MASNTITRTPFLLTAARAAMAERGELKGVRPRAARMFIEAETADERANVVIENAGLVRRGLREQAKYWAKQENGAEVCNVFWMLRDAIDEVEASVVEEMLLDDGTDDDGDDN